MSIPDMCSIKDVCDKLGASCTYVNRLIANGELKATRVGGRVFIYVESVLALLDAGESHL